MGKIEENGQVVTKFSITGYSLGGLVSRYVIGVLHQRKFFENVTPVNFNTFATPHIGLPRYPNFFSALANSLGPRLLSRTGEQFFAVDKWSPSGRPLLAVMADPGMIASWFPLRHDLLGMIYRSDFLSGFRVVPTQNHLRKRVSGPHISPSSAIERGPGSMTSLCRT